MAENPATWGPATEIINDALEEARVARSAGYVGFSTTAQIARALQKAGFLKEEDVWDQEIIYQNQNTNIVELEDWKE